MNKLFDRKEVDEYAAFNQAFSAWRAENPDRPAYEFGLELEVVECKVSASSRHIGTRGEVTCDCTPTTSTETTEAPA